jgi:acyl-CoA synthetase (AMP-forming)/AMP-acid ligase II
MNESAESIWRSSTDNVVAEACRRAGEMPEAPAVRFLRADGSERLWTRGALWASAGRCAAELQAAGLQPGQVCAMIFPFREDIGAWYWGAARLGALPAILSYPTPRLHPEKFQQGLRGMARHSGLDAVVTDAKLLPKIESLLIGGTVNRILCADSAASEKFTALPDDFFHRGANDEPFLLQHSSGTTGLQKAVVLSHGAVLRQLDALAEALRLRPEKDVIVSWLPLYHDMGLIAAWLLPFLSGTPQVQLSPFDWVARPAMFLEALSSCGGTLGWLPNFAFNFTADRVAAEELSGIRLDRVRALINCSEPVRAHSHDRFVERFRVCGLRPEVPAASYALAENVFAVTQTKPGFPPPRITADAEALRRDGEVRVADDLQRATRVCVSSGRLLRGTEMKITDDDGRELPARRVGEVAIRSSYLFDGYRRDGRSVRENFRDGWFLTGDLGFIADGELYVVGRKKDLLIVGGKNLYPEDLEDVVGSVPGVLPGRVVAFGEYAEALGTETVQILAETEETDETARGRIAAAVRATVQAALEVQVFRVHLVPPRSLIKSSSGKIARKANVERWRAQAGGTEGVACD